MWFDDRLLLLGHAFGERSQYCTGNRRTGIAGAVIVSERSQIEAITASIMISSIFDVCFPEMKSGLQRPEWERIAVRSEWPRYFSRFSIFRFGRSGRLDTTPASFKAVYPTFLRSFSVLARSLSRALSRLTLGIRPPFGSLSFASK